jgi:hypothetical protein
MNVGSEAGKDDLIQMQMVWVHFVDNRANIEGIVAFLLDWKDVPQFKLVQFCRVSIREPIDSLFG